MPSPQRPWERVGLTHLVRQPGDEHVAAHGRVPVHEAGAGLAALVLPQQTRLVDEPAEGDGPRDAPCGKRLAQYPTCTGARRGGWAVTRPRKVTSVTGVLRGCELDSSVPFRGTSHHL